MSYVRTQVNAKDWIVLAPVIPLLPVIVTWWLPWEDWLPWGKIPKTISGPFLFYAAFVTYYFKAPAWVVGITIAWGLFECAVGIKERIHRRDRNAS